MVSLDAAALLESRIAVLEASVERCLEFASETSLGFAQAILPAAGALGERLIGLPRPDLHYGGIPALARAGFLIGTDASESDAFLRAVDRVRGRPKGGRDQLHNDDLALLGIANGLKEAAGNGKVRSDLHAWILDIANEVTVPHSWSMRARQLSADLLDRSGRLRADLQQTPDILALDLALRDRWPGAFSTVTPIQVGHRRILMEALLSTPMPADGDMERAAIWLAALRHLVRRISTALVPTYESLAETLKAAQSALRRWVWDSKPNRQGIGPARWLIDDESHVQAFLWAILEPRFGDDLVDEQYLPGFGQKQPRCDFGVIGLKTIVEVKIVRSAADFPKIEEEVAGDLGLYFSDPERFDRMIVFVYDDSDKVHPERYDTLRSALQLRDERVNDVIIVQRPGMIPGRSLRGPWAPTKPS